jgi:hypothetical protein
MGLLEDDPSCDPKAVRLGSLLRLLPRRPGGGFACARAEELARMLRCMTLDETTINFIESEILDMKTRWVEKGKRYADLRESRERLGLNDKSDRHGFDEF